MLQFQILGNQFQQNAVFYFLQTSSLGAICLLQSIPQIPIFPHFLGISSGPSFLTMEFGEATARSRLHLLMTFVTINKRISKNAAVPQ